MESNLSLSTGVIDIISYLKEGTNNITIEFKNEVFDNIFNKSFCDNNDSEDIDYNLILGLLSSIEILNLNNEENFINDKVYIELDQADNKISSDIETNDYKVEQDLLSKEDIEILNELKNKVGYKPINLSNNVEKIELSNREIGLLKKLDNIISEDIYKSSLVTNEKPIQLENINTINKLKLIIDDNLQKTDKELDTLQSIVNLDNNNFIISSNQLINRNVNFINNTSNKDIPIIRQEYIEEDIIKTVKYLNASSNKVITVKISPKELGDMTIKLINDNDESSVVITISKSNVFDLINENQNEIVKHLKDLNINIKEISIEIKNSSENDFSSNLNQEFEKNNQRRNREYTKNIKLNDDSTDDLEEVCVDQNINILI